MCDGEACYCNGQTVNQQQLPQQRHDFVVQSTVCYLLSLAAVFAAGREFERNRVSDGNELGASCRNGHRLGEGA